MAFGLLHWCYCYIYSVFSVLAKINTSHTMHTYILLGTFELVFDAIVHELSTVQYILNSTNNTPRWFLYYAKQNRISYCASLMVNGNEVGVGIVPFQHNGKYFVTLTIKLLKLLKYIKYHFTNQKYPNNSKL